MGDIQESEGGQGDRRDGSRRVSDEQIAYIIKRLESGDKRFEGIETNQQDILDILNQAQGGLVLIKWACLLLGTASAVWAGIWTAIQAIKG